MIWQCTKSKILGEQVTDGFTSTSYKSELLSGGGRGWRRLVLGASAAAWPRGGASPGWVWGGKNRSSFLALVRREGATPGWVCLEQPLLQPLLEQLLQQVEQRLEQRLQPCWLQPCRLQQQRQEQRRAPRRRAPRHQPWRWERLQLLQRVEQRLLEPMLEQLLQQQWKEQLLQGLAA